MSRCTEPSPLFFVTFNADRRYYEATGDSAPLAKAAKTIVETAKMRHAKGDWRIGILTVMPDYVHLIARNGAMPIKRVVTALKRYSARICGIRWQRDFFDHRIRDADDLRNKADYIRMNPVAKGLCAKAEDWQRRSLTRPPPNAVPCARKPKKPL